MSEEDYEGDDGPSVDEFPLSEQDLKILAKLAANLRSSLAKADAQFIRSAASAILVIERLPKPTPGAQVDVGYRTPNTSGNMAGQILSYRRMKSEPLSASTSMIRASAGTRRLVSYSRQASARTTGQVAS